MVCLSCRSPRLGVEQRRHVLQRVVGFEVRGLVADQPVADRMRLAEPVAGEVRDEVEQLTRGGLLHPPAGRSSDELGPLRGHLGLSFLPMAARRTSASPRPYPATAEAICITWSW